MDKKERAKNWTNNIEEAKNLSIEDKIKVCDKVATKMVIVYFLIIILMLILVYILNIAFDKNGFLEAYLNNITTKVNDNFAQDQTTSKKNATILSLINMFPILLPLVVPVATILILKKKWIIKEINKLNNN